MNCRPTPQNTAHYRFPMAGWRSPGASPAIGRLHALGHTHDVLSESGWREAGLQELIFAELSPHGIGDGALQISGPPVRLKPQAALFITLALHELSTNAAKYGALSVSSGRISVRWHRVASSARSPELLKIEWRESGGPRVVAPVRRGFGSLFVEASIAADLQGTSTIAFEAEGVRCTMELPCEVLA